MKSSLLSLLLVVFFSPRLASAVAITTTSVPNGTVQTPYSAVINASGGCTPYSWTIVSGTLPPGITPKVSGSTTSLDLAGTPTKAGSYSFQASVTDCRRSVSNASYKIVIQSGANHVVDLTWKPSTSKNIAGYNVYRQTTGAAWKKINAGLIASTLYSDPTVANNTTYYYAATAVDISGHESSKTVPVKAVIP